MTRSTLVFLYIIIFTFCSLKVVAQTTHKDSIPLISFLKQIEIKYGVSFSYADSNLEGKKISPKNDERSLDELIKYLERKTDLSFKVLDNTILIIKPKSPRSYTLSSTQQLEEVLITNYLTKGVSLKNDGSTRIKPESFGILPGLIEPDVLQTIQALPGVQSVDERVSNVNIRGGTHDQNLILWDGIKMYQSGHFFGLISAFNPYLTEEVIVLKNGSNPIYGDGVSSVIDMRSSNTVSDDISGGGGLNLINIDGYAKIPFNKKMELQVSTRRSITDLIATPTYDQYFKRVFQDSDLTNHHGSNSISKDERFYFYDGSLKFIYDISPKDKLTANFLLANNSLNYNEVATTSETQDELNSKLNQSNLATSVEYSRSWNSRFSTAIQVYLSKYNLEATNFNVLNNQRLIQENEVYDNGIKTKFNYILDDNFNLSGGYQFTEVGVSNLEDVNNPFFRSYIKEVIRTHSLFKNLEFESSSKNTIANIGVRANYLDKFSKTIIEPRFSFSQRFLNYFRFEILGELKSQSTSQIIDLQNDFLGIEKRRWVLSNESTIPVIKSKQLSSSIRFSKNGFIINAEAYIKKVNGITTRSQGFQNQYQFIHPNDGIGDYLVKGIDFLVNKQFNDISAWFSYSYSKNDYRFKNLNLNQSFPNNADIRHALTFAGTYSIDKFKFALGVNWRTGKPYTQPDNSNPISNNFINYQAPNSSRLDDYLRADFSTTYTFKVADRTNAIAGFSIWNVLNKKNTVNTYYIINDENSISQIDNLSLGITPNFSFRLKF